MDGMLTIKLWLLILNKKAQHPVGLFYIFDAFGITPVVPASLLFLLLFLSGASCSLCPHDRWLGRSRIAAKGLNPCTPGRTTR